MQTENPFPQERLVSLDAFRGLTIAGMFVVLNHGTWNREIIWDQLFHPEWHGFTITDLVLPFFIFIVGVALPFSYDKRLAHGDSFTIQLRHALKRFVLLVLFGNILYINARATITVNFWGALQVIGFCYLFAFLTLPLKTRTQALIIAATLIFYSLVFIVFHPPPGADNPYVFGNNIGTLFDQWLLGQTHPQGYVTINILGGIPNCILGVMVGKLLKNDLPVRRKIITLLACGIAGVLVGLAIDPLIPINKKLWTSSFTVYAGGWSLLFFLLFYWIIDIKGYKRWTLPLVIYGLNPITIYMINGLWRPWILYRWSFNTSDGKLVLARAILNPLTDTFGKAAGSYLFTALIVFFLWSICYWMYRRRIFLKL
ncbi:MAG TPA: DUF5009 domain-containing protein [archaeon]|nr:DUF5009 domain-containing protein [archaeon]